MNGLIRRFFPKKTDFVNVKEFEVKIVEFLMNYPDASIGEFFLLNTIPRKCLNYLTTFEALVNE
ncbi:MAG: hypothetical protein ISS81_04745 [Candidatus Marinimicrobia bacterium]|nr:hypothetical protein [Candidatus Neomarinimicrobiota bacterium]